MWENVIKQYFKDYIINDGDIISHPCNPKYAWARFDVCWERKCARTSEKLGYMFKNGGKYPKEWPETIFDLTCNVIFISDNYESVEKAFKRYSKKRFDLAEIDFIKVNGKIYHVIWD